MGVSPGSTWPFGSATTLRPSAARRTGTMTMVSSPRTTTPPAENSRLRGSRRLVSVDIAPQRDRVVDGEPSAALGDHAGALERGEKTAGRLPAGARQLRQVGLGGGDEDVGVGRALGARLVDELAEHGRHAALHRLEALAGEALVGRAQPPPERGDELDGDLGVLAHQPAHVGAEDGERFDAVDRLDGRRAAFVVEHRQLAEDVAGAEGRQGDRAAVRVLADGARVAGADDIARVARVALAEDDVTCRKPAWDSQLRDLAELARAEGLEDRDAREEGDRLVVRRRGHV